MRFQQERIVDPYGIFLGFNAVGTPCYQETVLQAAHSDFFVGDGSLGADWFILPVGAFQAGSLVTDAVFVQDCPGATQIFVTADVNAFGAAGLTRLSVSLEFQDPDNTQLWLPSREPDKATAGGIEAPLRNAADANRVWIIAAAGHYVLATRKEHEHFDKFRIRVQGDGAADGATDIRFYWAAGVHRSPW